MKDDPNLGKKIRYNSIAEADRRLREISGTAPKGGTYDKTDVKIVWANGNTYEGRWDVKHYSEPDNDNTISGHLKSSLNFYAGNTERGKEFIKQGFLNKKEIKYSKELLNKYQIE